ncbi:MAG: hypothetical protein L3J47_00550 [Sulfurovum sp.]|nr:hypothetical protein [Sulfurovum sp.]
MDFGSIKKLNWVAPVIHESTIKTELIKTYPTVPGLAMLHVAKSAKENYEGTEEEGDDLDAFMGKAVRTPVKYGPGGAQFQRKRDSSGKFSDAQDTGSESTAEDDQVNQQRDAHLRESKVKDALQGKNPQYTQFATKSFQEQLEDEEASGINDNPQGIMGQTANGTDVQDDPYSSDHSEFSQQDHQDASSMQMDASQAKLGEGDVQGAASSNFAAQVHRNQVADSMTPGDRFMDNLFNQQGAPEIQPGQQDQFMDLLGLGPPQPQMSNPAVAGDGTSMYGVQDPMMAQQDPMMAQQDQNKPVAPSPMDGPKPGMVDASTGSGVGPQTNVGYGGQMSDPPSDGSPYEEEEDESLAMKAINALQRYVK